VREFVVRHRLNNIKCLPYQPLRDLSASLSAADLHVVVMGEPFVGIVHPCKVYNIMSIGTPALYIGPTPSHVTDIASQRQHRFFLSDHGDCDAVTAAILECRQDPTLSPQATGSFSKEKLLPQFVALIESSQDVQEFSELPKSENAVPSPGR
jgi:colanic acid biosynthesis glycosyl transferase WcaI